MSEDAHARPTREAPEPLYDVNIPTSTHAERARTLVAQIFKYGGMEVRISYSGQVTSADEIKFTRQVAEIATEELVAKRVKG